MSTPAFDPQPCIAEVTVTPGVDVENVILCDVDESGVLLGTALAVYNYDSATGAAVGAPTFVDPVTGAPYVPVGTLQVCPGDVTAETLTAQARQLTNGTPWTPGGDVVGTLTSLTVTGVSGLWDMVDSNGTALTGLPAGLTMSWTAEDANTLTGPTSVTPQAGASVVAVWTQR